VDYEPVSANSIVEPRTLKRPLHFRLPRRREVGTSTMCHCKYYHTFSVSVRVYATCVYATCAHSVVGLIAM